MNISEILGSQNETIKTLGLKVEQYKRELVENQISKDEYDSLCSELLDVKKVLEEANTEELKQELEQVISFLLNFVKL